MLSTIAAVALLCSPRPPTSWQQKSGNFTVELALDQGPALSVSDATGLKWRQHHPHVYASQVLVADDGTLIIDTDREGKLEVIAIDGKPRGTVSLAGQFTEEELEKLPFSTCGRSYFSNWHTEGNRLLLDAPQGGNRRPTEPAGPALTFTVDLATLQVTRPPPAAVEPTEALIARFRAATTDDTKRTASDALMARARQRAGKGDPALRALCHEWVEAKVNPQASWGVTCLESAGTDAEVDALARSAASSADSEILSALDRRKSNARFEYALRILTEHREPEQLRRNAVFIGCNASSPEAFKTAKIAAQDPSAKVRGGVAAEVGQWPPGDTAFEVLTALAMDPDQEVRDRARERLLSSFFARGEREYEHDLIELVTHGKLQAWGAGWIVLGGIDEVHNKPAADDYRKGLQLIGSNLPHHGSSELALWAEAKLRLAQLVLDAGDKKQAKALANDVLTAKPNGNVRAPKPNEFSGYASRSGVTIRDPSSAAQEILDLVAAKKKKR